MEKRTCGAGHHTFAAGCAGFGAPPWVIEIGDDPRVAAATGDIASAGTLDVPAGPHAAGAEDAAVVVQGEASMPS